MHDIRPFSLHFLPDIRTLKRHAGMRMRVVSTRTAQNGTESQVRDGVPRDARWCDDNNIEDGVTVRTVGSQLGSGSGVFRLFVAEQRVLTAPQLSPMSSPQQPPSTSLPIPHPFARHACPLAAHACIFRSVRRSLPPRPVGSPLLNNPIVSNSKH